MFELLIIFVFLEQFRAPKLLLMFKQYITALVLFLFPFFVLSNTEQIEFKSLLDSAKTYRFIDIERSNFFFNETYAYLRENEDDFSFGEYYFERSYNSIINANYERAIRELEQGNSYLNDFKDSVLYLKVNHRIANTYFLNGDYNLALNKFLATSSFISESHYNDSLYNFKEIKKLEAFCYKNVAVVYYVVFAEKKAYYYYKKAAEIFSDLEEMGMLKYCYYSIAGCYLEQNDLYYANKYIQKGKDISNEFVNEIEIGDFNLTEAYYYLKSDELDSVEYHIKKSKDVYRKYNDEYGLAVADIYLAELLMKQKKYHKAQKILESSYKYLKDKDDNRISLKTQKLLSLVYSKNNRHIESRNLIIDAIETQDLILKNAELFFSYEIESKIDHNRKQYIDSINQISNNYRINEFKKEIENKSIFNNYLLLTLLFFILVIATLVFLLKRNKKVNIALNESLADNQVLFQEVHHRVKNNFQIISSLLSLQTMNSIDDNAKKLLQESQQRILSMAFVHELLYKNNKIDEIDAKEYIKELSRSIISTFRMEDKNIIMNIEAEDHHLNLEQAIPVGLILNEAITNSVKYAFKDRSRGLITVKMENIDDESVRLTVSDNGSGFNLDSAIENNSLGLELIEVLTDQINGEYNIESEKGTKIEVTFKNRYQG